MTVQPDLFGNVPEPKDWLGPRQLGPRQRHVVELLERHPDGLTADEVGAHLHEHRGRHPADARCDWCGTEGRVVLGALRSKGLVVRRRSGGRWQLTGENAPAATESLQTRDIPF